MFAQIADYFNPIAHLGDKRYSYVYPTLLVLGIYTVLELIAKFIWRDQDSYGIFIIVISIATIIYSAFRYGIRGGYIAAGITVAYYSYIIFTRSDPNEIERGIETVIGLGLLYLFMGWVIGWLKQTIDELIDREADERRHLQTILQQLPVGVLVIDKEGKVTQVNKRLEKIVGTKVPIGYTFEKDKESIITTYAGKKVSASEMPVVQALRSGRQITGQEYEIDRNGKRVILQVGAAPINNTRGKTVASVSILTDITEQKELEERKDDFINMASHELKTPLTSMKLYLDLLSRKIAEHKDRGATKLLGNIKNQTDRLQELVNDLLDVSRIQTGKLNFSKESFRLDELVKETVNELGDITNNQKLAIVKSTQVQVSADRFRIYQVLTNLITNAVKYSGEGKNINVKVEKKAGKAIVSVQDFGIGIAKDQLKKVFDRLYQVTDPKEKTFPGLGMGLYISKEIMRRHKGNIWVESEKGKGSTFFFSLPLQNKKNRRK